jgi:hypothetical protein
VNAQKLYQAGWNGKIKVANVNPKLKCHPNAQSRNVTFLLTQNAEFTATFFSQH